MPTVAIRALRTTADSSTSELVDQALLLSSRSMTNAARPTTGISLRSVDANLLNARILVTRGSRTQP